MMPFHRMTGCLAVAAALATVSAPAVAAAFAHSPEPALRMHPGDAQRRGLVTSSEPPRTAIYADEALVGAGR